MVFVTLLGLQLVFPALMKQGAGNLALAPMRSLLYGILFAVSIPLAVLVAVCSVIGLPLGVLLLTAYLSFIIFSGPVTALLLANLINNVYKKQWKYIGICSVGLAIFILLKMASLAPYIGFITNILFKATALGAVAGTMHWAKNRREERVTAPSL